MSPMAWTVTEPGPLGGTAVWSLDLALTPSRRAACRAILSAEEAARAERFVRGEDRDRFAASHAALRLILGRILGRDPRTLAFGTGPWGKPELHEELVAQLHFNLSHSGAQALVAVSATTQIGVDLELMRPMTDALRIARAHFAPGEVAALEACDPGTLQFAFHACWTRKEAVVKALGTGLSMRLDRFAVSIPPAPPAVLHIDGDAGRGDAWTLQHLQPAPGYIGAVAIEAAGARCTAHRLAPDWPDRLGDLG